MRKCAERSQTIAENYRKRDERCENALSKANRPKINSRECAERSQSTGDKEAKMRRTKPIRWALAVNDRGIGTT
jgi:hypothetical protein